MAVKRALTVIAIALVVVGGVGFIWFADRYAVPEQLSIPLTESTAKDYPEDPADRSEHYGRYHGRTLQLVQRDSTHFDFVIEPRDTATARITFKNIDASLFATGQPQWTREDEDLEVIAVTDREWNRQQVSFPRSSEHLEITGGDGFERTHLVSAEIAKNCLNAGLWEILLFVEEAGNRKLYYQGWFTFPLGHYKRLVEDRTGVSYWKHWWRLEHWQSPAGRPVELARLRRVLHDEAVPATFLADEEVYRAGEQRRKEGLVQVREVRQWRDFLDGRDVSFASFVPPGRYAKAKPHGNEYWRLAEFLGARWRRIESPGATAPLDELELLFRDRRDRSTNRILVSGFTAAHLPQLPTSAYHQGLYMPMGIGVPPFFQPYDNLEEQPPWKSPFFSLWLDADSRWIDHHQASVDGTVIYRDEADPAKLHVHLVSYERQTLLGHLVIGTSETLVTHSKDPVAE